VPVLRLEHVALNVADPAAMAGWYVAHLGMRVVRQVEGPPHTRFLADAGGTSVVEIYRNAEARLPDYAVMDPLELHLAFDSRDPDADRDALVLAGATALSDARLPDGSRLLMLRDPWGLALQLCARATPLLEQPA
jgi:glyoxylase I family protein